MLNIEIKSFFRHNDEKVEEIIAAIAKIEKEENTCTCTFELLPTSEHKPGMYPTSILLTQTGSGTPTEISEHLKTIKRFFLNEEIFIGYNDL